jgi:hypothetical protein
MKVKSLHLLPQEKLKLKLCRLPNTGAATFHQRRLFEDGGPCRSECFQGYQEQPLSAGLSGTSPADTLAKQN